MDKPEQLEPPYISTFRYYYLIEEIFRRLKDHDELSKSHRLAVPIEYPWQLKAAKLRKWNLIDLNSKVVADREGFEPSSPG